MDRQIPFAAESAAEWVSSERWADASYPVIVYWVRITDSGSTPRKNAMPPLCPPKKPVLFTVCVNTEENDAWCLGAASRMSTTVAAPATCHHTEMLFRIASSWLEKMFTRAASARMIAKITKTRLRL
jgi:hypothetical protein